MNTSSFVLRFLLVVSLYVASAFVGPTEASAQYKNAQIGFDIGYMFNESDSLLDEHGVLVALRGAYKASDHWWFSARAGLSFRGETAGTRGTAIVFHLMPVDARYYFKTDSFRPFVGIGNAFQFLFNNEVAPGTMWGPGALGGVEIKIVRDVFVGLQLDAYYMFVFEGPDYPVVTATSQLIFFL